MQKIPTLLDNLAHESEWLNFYNRKKESGYLTKQDDKLFFDFIENKRFIEFSEKIIQQGFYFDAPQIKLVNKSGTNKKRVVYCFKPDETIVLKFIASLLNRYDNYFCPLLFSFRKELSVRRAIKELLKKIDSRPLYCYKLDISNYFNSIDVKLLLPMLQEIFSGDEKAFQFFEGLLYASGSDNSGVMAGTPTSPFLANVYLSDLDKHFYHLDVPYARYSDDIIVFAQTEQELTQHVSFIHEFLAKRHLTVNTKKQEFIPPLKAWSFLGIEYSNGQTDLSAVTKDKIKAKIRRKARSIYRWKTRKNAPHDKAVQVMTKSFNKKFFINAGKGELTWSRWYFPLLTTDKGLKEIDNYLQMWLRYLKTGKHNKKNFSAAPYEYLKQNGYISLVNKYYDN